MTGGQYAVARAALIARAIQILVRMWLNLGSWRDTDIARFQRQALPILAAAQRTLGQMTAVRIADSAARALGKRFPPPSIPDELVNDVREGVSVEEEYRRPFEQTWYGLSQGEDIGKASDRGRIRLIVLADVDLQVAETKAASHAMEQAGALWWKRVPQGEKTCLLCLVASTRAYHVAELKPIHPACDCTIEEQFSRYPEGGVHDEELLRRAYQAVKQQTGRVQTSGEVLRTLLADFTGVNSETGPILVTPRGNRAERARVTPG